MTISERNKQVMLKRLLDKCEYRARENGDKYDWRLEKYVEAADTMVRQLSAGNDISKELIRDYMRRVEFLKKIVDSKQKVNPMERAVAIQMMPHGMCASENFTKEIQQKISSKYTKDLREELFSSVLSGGEIDLRQRKSDKTSSEDLDLLQKYHHSMQEKIAESMLQLTRNLKEQSQLANNIIKRDTETMGKTTKATDDNLLKLKKESQVLDEHNRRAWKCWLWMIIFSVIVIFLGMVIFMKIVRKS